MTNPLLELVELFPGCPVLVVGDLMLDEFIFGQVSRISPEAPVPVVEVQRRSYVPGGAANTAANVAALGATPSLAGLVGADANADHVRDLLRTLGCEMGQGYLLARPERAVDALLATQTVIPASMAS